VNSLRIKEFHVVEILLCQGNQGDKSKSIALFQNEGLISVPTECFVAVALLSLQKTFAADASLSGRASWRRPMSRLGQQEVGHEGVVTGRDDFSLCSPNLLAPGSPL